jgi:hypothetical protein
MVCSKSLAKRQLRPLDSKVRSTIQQLGNPLEAYGMTGSPDISTAHFPILRDAARRLLLV